MTLFDTGPETVAEVYGDALPGRTRRAYRRYRHGPAAYKVDLAVRGGVPWTNEAARRAGTVHVGGTLEEIAEAEAEVCAGRMPERPFILVAQQSLADPTRAAGDLHPVWAYAHVPTGWDGPGEQVVLDQLERFAPGLRERVVATAVRTPADFAAGNPNYVGGDIAGGANDLRQLWPGPGWRRTRTPPASRASTSARRRPRRAPGCTACAATAPPPGRCAGSDERADRLDRLVDLVGVGGDAGPEPDVGRGVRRRAAHHAGWSRSLKTKSGGRWPATSKQTMPAERSG